MAGVSSKCATKRKIADENRSFQEKWEEEFCFINGYKEDSQIAAKLTCGRTKASAITRNVLGPYSQEKVISELKECYYFSVASDASNVGNLKTFPYAVQYFNCNKGICRKLLDFYEEAEETSLDIYNCLKKITTDSNLSMDQISAYSADNASVNYGAHNSVFQKLKEENNHIFKANCYCHVVNNCVKYALKGLDVDIESIVIKIYNEFSSSALKTKKLKECCEFSQIEYKELLRHVPTRWLSLLPAIDRLIRSWPAVKHYFLSKGRDNCHKVLWDFISEGCSTDFMNNDDEECKKEGKNDCYLFFLSNILPEFTKVILLLESESFTILDIDHAMRSLHDQLKSRMADNFFGSKVRDIFRKLDEEERALFKGQNCPGFDKFLSGNPSHTRGCDFMEVLKEFVEKHGIPVNKLISVCTDGCPSMVGANNGLIALMKKEWNLPNLLPIHCLLHQETLA
ncbi:hypothetical protein HF086_001154 [Spodoptera exigua]|uniref:DUF4371 domain-containing protein n=1 Tax=Spodoptera exigua TaxID=7107 RepID=A0A922S8L1_SPOEX|nr:hypothetical protein HF086_001154 [Spodoptera exigua]